MDPAQNPTGDAPTATEPTQDELEWADTAREFNEERGGEEPSNEPTESKKDDEKEGAPEGNPEGKKSDEEQKSGNDPEKKTEGDPGEEAPTEGQPQSEPTVRDRLTEERELEALKENTTKDIRERLFSDRPTRLEDADGDPIETVADVMQLQNPVTGKKFTQEEAASWLLQAQNHFEKEEKKTQAEVAKIVDTSIAIKYDLDAIKSEYGELLKHMPKLRQRVADEWLKTVEFGSDGETIAKTKIGMKDFYDMVLAPYVKQVKDMEAKEKTEAEAKAKADAEAQAKNTQQQKTQTRTDREDVFSIRTKTEDMDPEEKEWAQAAKDHYEG